MTTPLPHASELVQRAQLALGDVHSSAQAFRAWQSLQARDDEGNVRGTLPYTDTALAEFEAAYQNNPDNIGLVHHLAIAHHARAWDWELANDERAAEEWELALNYWRRLAFAPEFWQQLKHKLHSCDAQSDAGAVDKMRRDLLENLLDVQVDFVRKYCEGDDLKRAVTHVRIVQRAKIPPAVKKRLVDKVFSAMTGSVPEARARNEHDSALVTLERFLGLFPDYLPGLRLYAEVCSEYLPRLSYWSDWTEIRCLSERALIWMRRLAAHAELEQEALARAALQDVSFEFLDLGDDRGYSCQTSNSEGTGDDARTAYELGLGWARLAYPTSSSSDRLRVVMFHSLFCLSVSLKNEVADVNQSDADHRTKLTASINLLRRACELMQEAKVCCPEEQQGNDFFKRILSTLSTLESEKTQLDLVGEIGE